MPSAAFREVAGALCSFVRKYLPDTHIWVAIGCLSVTLSSKNGRCHFTSLLKQTSSIITFFSWRQTSNIIAQEKTLVWTSQFFTQNIEKGSPQERCKKTDNVYHFVRKHSEVKLALFSCTAWPRWMYRLGSWPWSLLRCQGFSLRLHHQCNGERGEDGKWRFYINRKVDIFSGTLWNVSQTTRGLRSTLGKPPSWNMPSHVLEWRLKRWQKSASTDPGVPVLWPIRSAADTQLVVGFLSNLFSDAKTKPNFAT